MGGAWRVATPTQLARSVSVQLAGMGWRRCWDDQRRSLALRDGLNHQKHLIHWIETAKLTWRKPNLSAAFIAWLHLEDPLFYTLESSFFTYAGVIAAVGELNKLSSITGDQAIYPLLIGLFSSSLSGICYCFIRAAAKASDDPVFINPRSSSDGTDDPCGALKENCQRMDGRKKISSLLTDWRLG
ncbi:hypothetical protein AXF42_Ash017987 [Apostasia shenzhenica]|uniref:Uncharacterized protein n=1 Tax=Apostasia shenzhenica TaxID=1088818 RepID=A0A2I0A523_9ASPA|nr:hypothetical protein AXF42_Ash017987 [Apostasia shenzhenica]